MQWRLVTEGHPSDMEPSLLFDELEGICIGYFFKAKNCFVRELDGLILSAVYSWMSLPYEPERPD